MILVRLRTDNSQTVTTDSAHHLVLKKNTFRRISVDHLKMKMLPFFESRAAKPHNEAETEQMLKTLETFPLPHERQKDMLIGVLFNGYVKFC